MARWFSWLECRPVTAEVVGSSPIRVAICGNSSVVEHLLAKEGVAGPNPVSRLMYFFTPNTLQRAIHGIQSNN